MVISRTEGRLPVFLVALCLLASACGTELGDEDQDTGSNGPAAIDPPMSTPGAVDEQLAATGEGLFTQKACGSCHTIGGGRLVGPDLKEVTERRTRDWIVAMILNPDSMVRTDSIARRLLAEYFTPMANQNLSRDDAVALYHFLLSAPDNGAVGDIHD